MIITGNQEHVTVFSQKTSSNHGTALGGKAELVISLFVCLW